MIITSYHVFADNVDEFVSTRKEAEEVYKCWRDEEGHNNIRIYKCTSDNTLDDEVEEEYIKGRGNFPW
jgi:serine/threonine-protein kinase RIO1